MEELPKKAKAVMGIYATAATIAEGTAVYFNASKDDLIITMVTVTVVLAVASYVYIRLYFKNYRYLISDGVIKIKKGAFFFKRRHLIYVKKISNITVSENFVQRIFGLCTVWFHMSGSVVKLSYVAVEKSDELQKILYDRN